MGGTSSKMIHPFLQWLALGYQVSGIRVDNSKPPRFRRLILQKSRLCILVHQEFQVPKMEVRKPTYTVWIRVFPYISRIHTAYIGEHLHFRYLKCLVISRESFTWIIPKTKETNKATDGTHWALKIGVSPGFGGLMKRAKSTTLISCKRLGYPMTDPCMIYLHEWLIFVINPGQIYYPVLCLVDWTSRVPRPFATLTFETSTAEETKPWIRQEYRHFGGIGSSAN